MGLCVERCVIVVYATASVSGVWHLVYSEYSQAVCVRVGTHNVDECVLCAEPVTESKPTPASLSVKTILEAIFFPPSSVDGPNNPNPVLGR